MQTCPTCRGTRVVEAFVEAIDSSCSGYRQINCSTCKGEGEISEEQAARILNGKKLREMRHSAGRIMRETAERNNISVTDVSSIEFGRLDPPEGYSP